MELQVLQKELKKSIKAINELAEAKAEAKIKAEKAKAEYKRDLALTKIKSEKKTISEKESEAIIENHDKEIESIILDTEYELIKDRYSQACRRQDVYKIFIKQEFELNKTYDNR